VAFRYLQRYAPALSKSSKFAGRCTALRWSSACPARIVRHAKFQPRRLCRCRQASRRSAIALEWEIYCAGKRLPIERSSSFFATMETAHTEGKKALTELIDRLEA
jgi:hypothetical protein